MNKQSTRARRLETVALIVCAAAIALTLGGLL